ncbi:hypothetical protein [Tsuneonella amylolytica]|uniref:hypothetical protein n=1 Tax=Tsuneonella amylolytica TaxID=2338327 RepID=UPI001F3FFB44|nr:hypothetical protein [Tsuneonella amylolytica]
MGIDCERTDRLTAASRLAGLPPLAARAILALIAALILAAAFVPFKEAHSPAGAASRAGNATASTKPARDADLEFYEAVADRIAARERYYDFIVPAQRAAGYPVNPGFAVRLPTLAYLSAWLGSTGLLAAAIALTGACAFAWWRRLGEEVADPGVRRIAFALLLVGLSLGLNRHFFPLHEFWAGMLLALSLALHRPDRGRWGAALAVAALALAIRELALPFVILMAAMAAWRRDWREAAAWGALVAIFVAGLAVHFQLVAASTTPADPRSASWIALGGLPGWLSKIVLTTNLRLLPQWIAAPVVVLAMVGWTSWRGRAGATGALLFGGYAVAFMIAGRPENYYWGALVGPAFLAGLAFAPEALGALWRSAARKGPTKRPALS